MIAPLIKWDHSTEWYVPEENRNDISSERKVVVNVSDKDSEYMKGHIIDGKMSHLEEVNCCHSINGMFPFSLRSLSVACNELFAFGTRIVGAHDTRCNVGHDER